VSDQNQWPKPGETPEGSNQAPAGPASHDPWAQSGQGSAAQGATGGHSAPYNPYAAPSASPQHNPYAAPGQQQGAYGQQQGAYGQSQNPYAAPQHPYGQQPGANPYATPYASGGYQPYAQRPKTNILAVLSIVFGLGAVPFFFMAILLGPAGAILGHVALGKIKQSGEAGRGLALTGIIAGWVMTGFWILWVVALFAFAGIGNSYSDYDYDGALGAVAALVR